MSKEQLDSVSRNWFKIKKVQWLTKPMSIPGSSAEQRSRTLPRCIEDIAILFLLS